MSKLKKSNFRRIIPYATQILLAQQVEKKILNKHYTIHNFKKHLEQLSDDELYATYVPDVYQEDIYAINYEKLRKEGIKVISFDIDDTITAFESLTPSHEVLNLFNNLKDMGFTIFLLTNAYTVRARSFAKALGVKYVANADKPYSLGFNILIQMYEKEYQETLTKNQIAHVGNNIIDDIMGGNSFGITTCLVRRVGNLTAIGLRLQIIAGVNENHCVRSELKHRGLWYAHHYLNENDQYYQLNELPKYVLSS